MNERTSLDRDLVAYLDGRSTNRAPAGLLEATSRESKTRQRPAWLVVGRRLADRRPVVWAPPVSARLVIAAVLLFALLIGALVAVGSQAASRRRSAWHVRGHWSPSSADTSAS